MATQSEITVVIPTFNRKDQLAGALESVLCETRVPIRIHVFDNASVDETAEFLTDMVARDSRIHVYRNAENVGAERNYIAALDSVETAYFVPLADDDRLKPEFLHDAYNRLETSPETGAAVYFSDCETETGEFALTYPHQEVGTPEGYLSVEDHLREFFLRGHYVWSSILWRKAVLDHIGHPYLHTGMPSDVDFQVSAFSKFPVFLSREIGAIYTVHADQHSSGFSARELPGFVKILDRMDRNVAPFFNETEYADLRGQFFNRYSGLWKLPPKRSLAPSRIYPLAAIAGARLGDWDFAEKLLLENPQDDRDPSLLGALVDEVLRGRKEIRQLRAEILDQQPLPDTVELHPDREGVPHAEDKTADRGLVAFLRRAWRLLRRP